MTKMTKIEMMKVVLANTEHYYNVSTPQLLESVARKQVTRYTKAQLQELVDNLDKVTMGIKIC